MRTHNSPQEAYKTTQDSQDCLAMFIIRVSALAAAADKLQLLSLEQPVVFEAVKKKQLNSYPQIKHTSSFLPDLYQHAVVTISIHHLARNSPQHAYQMIQDIPGLIVTHTSSASRHCAHGVWLKVANPFLRKDGTRLSCC